MTKQCLGLLFVTCAGAIAADITPLNVKPGEWETTIVSQGSGAAAAAAIRPEILAQMPPEQRAKMEAALKQASQPRITVVRRCVKKDDVNKAMALGTTRANCKETLVSSSSTKQEIHVECSEKGATSTSTVRVEAQNPETIKIDMLVGVTMNGQTTNTTNTATSKWIGAMCTEKQ